MGSHKGGKGVAAEASREVRLLWLMSRAAMWMLVSKLIQVTTHPRRPIVLILLYTDLGVTYLGQDRVTGSGSAAGPLRATVQRGPTLPYSYRVF